MNEVIFYKDGVNVWGGKHEEGEVFDQDDFNQKMAEGIKAWEEALAKYKPDNRLFTEIIVERQQLEQQQTEAESEAIPEEGETDPY